MPKVAVGGTFDPLHEGHKKLLERAIELARGERLEVGITSDEMARRRLRFVLPYWIRIENLKRFLHRKGIENVRIEKIEDAFGKTLEEDFDYLVVSPETEVTARKINEERVKRGMNEIKVVVVDWIIAEDGKPISSTRIRAGEIDRYGKVLEKRVGQGQ